MWTHTVTCIRDRQQYTRLQMLANVNTIYSDMWAEGNKHHNTNVISVSVCVTTTGGYSARTQISRYNDFIVLESWMWGFNFSSSADCTTNVSAMSYSLSMDPNNHNEQNKS